MRLFVALVAMVSPALALTITFDYSYDTGGFFTGANSSRQSVLNSAAAAFTSLLTDSLSAITPSGNNTWTASFFNPSNTSATVSLSNLSISANTIVIYVGATDLGSGVLGQGGPGGYSATGTSGWLNTVAARGQTGGLSNTNPTDFGPWGGAISFSSTASWNFDPTQTSFSGQSDLYSVAIHEIGHVLGIGTAGSWFTYVSGGVFTGANAVAAYGGNVPLSSGNSHWASNVSSTVVGSTTVQETAMDPDLTIGTRKYLTALDLAGLRDIGWATAVPESPVFAWAAIIGAVGLLHWRRRRRD